MQEFTCKTNKTIDQNSNALEHFRTACEHAMHTLSSATQADIKVDSLHYYSFVSRRRFEMLNDDLFRRSLKPVKKALRNAELETSDIDDIVLVGR